MPGIRLERLERGSDDRPKRLGALAETLFHISEDGTEATHRLISSTC